MQIDNKQNVSAQLIPLDVSKLGTGMRASLLGSGKLTGPKGRHLIVERTFEVPFMSKGYRSAMVDMDGQQTVFIYRRTYSGQVTVPAYEMPMATFLERIEQHQQQVEMRRKAKQGKGEKFLKNMAKPALDLNTNTLVFSSKAKALSHFGEKLMSKNGKPLSGAAFKARLNKLGGKVA